MALVIGNQKNGVQRRKKVIELEDTSDDSDSTDTCSSFRGSIDVIDFVCEYSASSSNSFDDVEDKEDDKKTDDLIDSSFQGTKEEQISRTLWNIDSQLTTLENHIQSTSFALASVLTGWDISRRILVPKSINNNIVNMCNHNSSSIAGVSSQADSYGNNLRSKTVDRVFRPAGLIDAGANYSIACKDGVDPETYSYIPLNGCYAVQKNLVRENIRMQKVGRKGGNRGPMLSTQTEEVKPSVQAEMGVSHMDLDFARSQSDYLLRHDSSPRTYSFLANQIHAIPGELSYMKDVSKEYVVIPPVNELSSKSKKAQPPSKASPLVNNQDYVNDTQFFLKQTSNDRGIENAYLQLVHTKKPERDLCEPEHVSRHPPSARSLAITSGKPLKHLEKAERFKSAPVCPVQNPVFLVSPSFLDDFETNCKNNVPSTRLNVKTTNEAVKKTTPSRSVSGRNLPVSCFENLADNLSNRQLDSFGLPEVVGSTANAVKRPLLKPGRASARESHKATIIKGKTNSATSKVDLHSERTTNQGTSNSQGTPDYMPFPSIQNFGVVSGTKLNGAFTISRILH